MTRHILSGPIKPPMIFLMPDGVPGGTDGTQNSQTVIGARGDITTATEIIKNADGDDIAIPARMEGEQEPDFDSIPDEDEPEGKAPEIKEKPAGEAVNAKEKALGEVEAPEIEEDETKKAADAKKAADDKAAADVEAAKKAETTEVPKIPDDDKDIDAIQPKPGSSPKIKNDFDKLKAQAKEARQLARAEITAKAALATEKAALEAKIAEVKPISPELETELKELRDYRAGVELANDPIITKEFDDKMATADEKLFAILRAEGMPEKTDDPKVMSIEKMKETGIDKLGDKWWNENILKKFADSPILVAKTQNALLAREDVKNAKNDRVAEISKNKEGYAKQQEEKQAAQWKEFSAKLNTKAAAIAKDYPWANPIAITDKMTAAEKTSAEAHNVKYTAREKQFVDLVQKAVNYDPDVLAELVCAKLEVEEVREQSKAGTEASKAEIDKHLARIEELESELAGMTRSGKITKAAGAAAKVPGQKTAVSPFGSVDDAFEAAGLGDN